MKTELDKRINRKKEEIFYIKNVLLENIAHLQQILNSDYPKDKVNIPLLECIINEYNKLNNLNNDLIILEQIQSELK